MKAAQTAIAVTINATTTMSEFPIMTTSIRDEELATRPDRPHGVLLRSELEGRCRKRRAGRNEERATRNVGEALLVRRP
jgi:hypothetical protein